MGSIAGAISRTVGAVTGIVNHRGNRRATRRAEREAKAGIDQGIKRRDAATEKARADLQPFTDAGLESLKITRGLINDPSKQLNFLENNPFFKSLQDDSANALLNATASRGKLGTGGTASELQKRFILLGQGLINNNVNQNMGLVNTGFNAATNQGNYSMGNAGAVSNMLVNRGNVGAQATLAVQASRNQRNNAIGKSVGDLADYYNNPTGNLNQVTNAAGGAGALASLGSLFTCDERLKENIRKIGQTDSGINLYTFNYIGDDQQFIGPIAQEVELVYPDAILHNDEGYKIINLNKLK